jgi:DNA-binding response OmpR family regulator
MGRVLIVEDEQHIADGIRFNLEAESYEVETAESGEDGLLRLSAEPFDVVVLDVMLPGIDGFEVARRLRAEANYVPLLMLTARGRTEDVLKGFAAGADDYLAKPFELEILLARVAGLLRRRDWSSAAPARVYRLGERTIDFVNLELRAHGRVLQLTRMEADLLKYLVDREGRTVSRKALLEEVWGVHEDTDTRAIDAFIVRLRRYIEDEPANPRHLLTVRGVGYRFVAQGG